MRCGCRSAPVRVSSRRFPHQITTECAMEDDLTIAAGGTAAATIGPYRLLQRIGEGGMGDVWLAEQTTPIHRRVALKVIKAGMDSRQVIARFAGTALARLYEAWGKPVKAAEWR